ncbi:MAG: PD-(D/E)XK nuclease family protein [Candidatus Latescibacteria bacterium]|nr:PD-(D/E)XK nuclease family protein [Candidatus Latescibacterota bacterium]
MIPQGFNYSQSSLTAFARCRRQFLLPAPLTDQLDEWEAAADRGRAFHQLVLQESLGMDVEDAVQRSRDPLLAAWWRNWREQPPVVPEGAVFGETMLSVPLAGRRLVAKFDRVVLADDGRAWIFDWKTGRKKPEQAAYVQSWQTLVYRFVLVEAGAVLNDGRALAPDDVVLVYWHAQYPQVLQPITYSAAEHERTGALLSEAIATIEALPDADAYAKTDDESECQRCQFHTYCNRPAARGDDWDIDEDELEWEQMPEAEL